MQLFGKNIPQSISLLFWFLVWELVGRLGFSSIFPPLSRIIVAGTTILPSEKFIKAVEISLRSFGIGMALSLVVGITLGVLMARLKTVGRILGTWVNIFVSAPISALVPVLMGVLGIGEPTVVATVFLFAVFVIILDTQVGISKADQSLIEMALLLRRPQTPDLHEGPDPQRPPGNPGRDPSGIDPGREGRGDRPDPDFDHRRGRTVRAVFEAFPDGGILGPRHRRVCLRVRDLRSHRLSGAPSGVLRRRPVAASPGRFHPTSPGPRVDLALPSPESFWTLFRPRVEPPPVCSPQIRIVASS